MYKTLTSTVNLSHEDWLILLPESMGNVEEMLSMVKYVNDSIVSKEDILSYHVYKYDCDEEKVLDLCA